METLPPEPSFKDQISASWMCRLLRFVRGSQILNGPGYKTRRGPNGTVLDLDIAKAVKPTADVPHPWKVFAFAESEERENLFEIYIPHGALHVGEDPIEIEGVTPVEGKDGRYTLDCEGEVVKDTVVFLTVVKERPDDQGVPADDDEERKPHCVGRIVTTLDSIEDDDVIAVLPIARLSIDDSGENTVAKVITQYAHSTVALGEPAADPDKISIDTVTAEDAKDPSAIQIKNFDNSESDLSQGLVQRIRVVKDGEDSFHLEADGAEVFIVARVKNRLKYIPLTGSKDKDPDELEENPCEHPGDAPGTGEEGGVSPDDEEPHGGGGGVTPGGGVPADGDVHAGEPCPDCSPTGRGVLAE